MVPAPPTIRILQSVAISPHNPSLHSDTGTHLESCVRGAVGPTAMLVVDEMLRQCSECVKAALRVVEW